MGGRSDREELERRRALHRLNILDTPPEERFDRLVRLAATVLSVPTAVISLVDADRQWHKACVGLEVAELPLEQSFCAHAVADQTSDTLVVPDATADHRFVDNPLVTVPGGIRFYAGHVVRSPEGQRVGTLCVVDDQPRDPDESHLAALADLASLVEQELARADEGALVEQLHQSEQLHRSILDTLAEGVILQGPDGSILQWNPAAERLLGLTGDQSAGRRLADRRWRSVRPDGSTWPREDHPPMACLRTGEAVAGQLMGIHRADGTLVWLEVSCQPTPGPEGKPRVLTVFVDVTSKRSLEAALVTSEEVARMSLDALDQGVVLFAPGGDIRRSNPAAVRILREPVEALTERFRSGRWQSFDDRGNELPTAARPLWRALAGETIQGEVIGWKRLDGSFALLRLSCVPNVDGRGSVLAAFTDVTDEHRALQDVARFKHLFLHSNDIITVIDADGRVRYASPSNERILGYPDGWKQADGILGFVHPDDMEATVAELGLLTKGERGPEPFVVRIRAFDGSWRHIETVGTNLLHEPAVRGIVLTARDATDRVLLTEQLAHLARHDPLTDLPNRSVLEPSLRQSLARTAREGTRTGLCFIDLDRFKQINDHHGHAAGDDVIREVASRIRSVIRAGDTAVRIGGDEFVVILDPVSGPTEAAAAARRIRDAIVEPPIAIGGHQVGASIGVAVSAADESPASILLRADASLYEAKATRSSAVALATA